MKVCVTGAFGLQGSALANRLTDQGYDVTVMDDASRGITRPRAKRTIIVDLCETGIDMNDFDAVFHLAARVGGTKFTHGSNNMNTVAVNETIDRNVIKAALRAGVPKFVYASSGSVYPLRRMASIGAAPLKESEDTDPDDIESGYASVKLSSEAKLLALKDSMKVSILRLFNVYGPGGSLDVHPHVIPALFKEGLFGKEIRLMDDGSAVRCFLYVEDAVDAYMRCLEWDYDSPINIGGAESVTIEELGKRIAGMCDRPLLKDEKRPRGVMSCIPDISLARTVLRWAPKTSLNEGLNKTKDWIERDYTTSIR